ncbi:hypothetical protein MMJ50_07640 [Enterococcus cecorum]|uniref:pLS20_p028 family conjugation system transmembrane protein n=1 Tax=Enterococcus cecorum TaxID=44008 RepID=UPI00148D53AA|nr:hypothetical protein [Enterococcus cecorum]MCJ0592593.1 hypothetical protein [Enterococcus cecorum]
MFQTFSEMVQKAGGSLDGSELSEQANKALLAFYRYWGNYLDAIPAFLGFLYKPLGMLALGLYYLTNSLEHVFNNLFKLLGLFGYLEDRNTIIGQFYYYGQLLGVTLFTLLLILRVLIGLFGKRPKYKDIINHVLLVTIVTAVLPMGITQITKVLANDMYNVQTTEANSVTTSGNVTIIRPSKGISYSSLALQPIKNNVVDLKVLMDNDFDVTKFPLDSQGFIKPVKANSTAVNDITDQASEKDKPNFIANIDFSNMLGTTNPELLEQLEKSYGNKGKGYKGLYLHKIDDLGTGITSITEHRMMKGLSAFEPVYPRYKVNWIGLFSQSLILIVLLLMMSVKVVKSIFETILTCIVAPIQGYTSVESSKKFKELVLTIGSAFVGIFFEMIIMRVMLEFMRDLPSLTLSGVSWLSGDFFDGLNTWEQCLTSIIVYLGIFFGAMQGVTVIERWLGVSTGHSDTMQQVIGGMMMANMATAGAKGLAHGMGALGSGAIDLAKRAPQGMKTVGNSIAKAGGGLSGAVDAVKEQGLKGAIQSGMANAGNAIGEKASGISESVMNALDQSSQAGYDSVKGSLTPDTPYGTGQLDKQTNENLQRSISSSSDEASAHRREVNEAHMQSNEQTNQQATQATIMNDQQNTANYDTNAHLQETTDSSANNYSMDTKEVNETGTTSGQGLSNFEDISESNVSNIPSETQSQGYQGGIEATNGNSATTQPVSEGLQNNQLDNFASQEVQPTQEQGLQASSIDTPTYNQGMENFQEIPTSDNGLNNSLNSSFEPSSSGLNDMSSNMNNQTQNNGLQSVPVTGMPPSSTSNSSQTTQTPYDSGNGSGQVPPSTSPSLPKTPTPTASHSTRSTGMQAKQAQQNFQQMQMNLQQSMQYMSGSRSHIKGVDIDED